MAKYFLRPRGLQGQERSDFKYSIATVSPLCLLYGKFPTQDAKTLKTASRFRNRFARIRLSVKLLSRIRIDPRLGELDDKFFGVIAAFEAIGQPGDAVRKAMPGTLPGNFRAGAPLLVALIERREGDNQALIVIEVRHRDEPLLAKYISRKCPIDNLYIHSTPSPVTMPRQTARRPASVVGPLRQSSQCQRASPPTCAVVIIPWDFPRLRTFRTIAGGSVFAFQTQQRAANEDSKSSGFNQGARL